MQHFTVVIVETYIPNVKFLKSLWSRFMRKPNSIMGCGLYTCKPWLSIVSLPCSMRGDKWYMTYVGFTSCC